MGKHMRIGGMLFLLALIFLPSGFCQAKTKWDISKSVQAEEGAFTFEAYVSTDQKQCWIYHVKVNPQKGDTSQIHFPQSIDKAVVTKLGYDESLYDEEAEFNNNIFGNSVEWAHDVDGYDESLAGIRKMELPKSVTEITSDAFSGMNDLETVKLPDGVKKVEGCLFYGCDHLKSAKLPAKLKTFNPGAFDDCKKLESITLSSKNKSYCVKGKMLLSKDQKTLVWAVPRITSLDIPSGIKSISNDALSDSEVKKVSIPASVSMIGAGAFSGENLTKITLDKKNKTFAKDGSCIYKKKDKSLVIGITDWGRIRISSKVQKIPNEFSITGTDVMFFVIPASVKKIGGDWLGNLPLADSSYAIYFMGGTPPKFYGTREGQSPLPVTDSVRVPKKSYSVYKKWLGKLPEGSSVKLQTFNPKKEKFDF